jgi:hypothetical protein
MSVLKLVFAGVMLAAMFLGAQQYVSTNATEQSEAARKYFFISDNFIVRKMQQKTIK